MRPRYIKEITSHKVKKKMVGARIPEVILSALQNAEKDSHETGVTFSTTEVIEAALLDTLKELNAFTGIDYYELEKFKFELRSYVYPDDPDIDINLDNAINEIKNKAWDLEDKLLMRSSIRNSIRECRKKVKKVARGSRDGVISSKLAHVFKGV